MLNLVNYGSSDEDDNISDEEESVAAPGTHLNGVNNGKSDDQDSFLEKSTKIQLPQPKAIHASILEEDDDEFLHKKAVPEVAPPPKIKQKVKIMIPKLSEFKEEEEDDDGPKFTGPSAQNRRTGLLGMLPKPAHSLGPTVNKLSSTPAPIIPKPSTTVSSSATVTSSTKPTAAAAATNQEVKKIGLIPYTLMEHKKTVESNKKAGKRKGKDSDDSDDDDDGTVKSFFSFNSNEDLPHVNEDEIKAMVERESNRIELRKMQAEAQEQPDYSQYYQEQQQQQEEEKSGLDQQAMRALVGGTRAKRSKLEGIEIVDISDQDVLPNKEDFIRKSLAGETSYMPTGQIDEKGPALAKRKHQISYLSTRAEKNIAELEAMWAANRQSNREGRSKYGF